MAKNCMILLSSRTAHPDYINTRLEEHTWYVGDMDRDNAKLGLSAFPNGAFLVRCRVANGERLGYALSLKTDNEVKHMRIDTCPMSPNTENNMASSFGPVESSKLYYFAETRKFASVVELVAWYSRNSLRESFSGLDTTLQFPIKELCVVEARYDFSPAVEDVNMLPLRPGEIVTVIDTAGDAQGWWKAHNGQRIGYIPKDFVARMSPT